MLYFEPSLGMKGFYELNAPLDVLISPNESFVCKSLRKLSDYLHNNENPKEIIYAKYGLTDLDYENDLKEDITIASLQNDIGHWINVPVRYFTKYPDLSGVNYKSYAIGISLPSFPITTNFDSLISSISVLISDMLGVVPEIRLIETSREITVSDTTHQLTTTERRARIVNSSSYRVKYLTTLSSLAETQSKLQALEQHIINN